MERIPLTSPDSELVEASHVRLKHAKELLDVDPTQFMYSGEVSLVLSPSFADLILFIGVPTNFPSKVAFIFGPSNVNITLDACTEAERNLGRQIRSLFRLCNVPVSTALVAL